jgi:hypothetical protein
MKRESEAPSSNGFSTKFSGRIGAVKVHHESAEDWFATVGVKPTRKIWFLWEISPLELGIRGLAPALNLLSPP